MYEKFIYFYKFYITSLAHLLKFLKYVLLNVDIGDNL